MADYQDTHYVFAKKDFPDGTTAVEPLIKCDLTEGEAALLVEALSADFLENSGPSDAFVARRENTLTPVEKLRFRKQFADRDKACTNFREDPESAIWYPPARWLEMRTAAERYVKDLTADHILAYHVRQLEKSLGPPPRSRPPIETAAPQGSPPVVPAPPIDTSGNQKAGGRYFLTARLPLLSLLLPGATTTSEIKDPAATHEADVRPFYEVDSLVVAEKLLDMLGGAGATPTGSVGRGTGADLVESMKWGDLTTPILGLINFNDLGFSERITCRRNIGLLEQIEATMDWDPGIGADAGLPHDRGTVLLMRHRAEAQELEPLIRKELKLAGDTSGQTKPKSAQLPAADKRQRPQPPAHDDPMLEPVRNLVAALAELRAAAIVLLAAAEKGQVPSELEAKRYHTARLAATPLVAGIGPHLAALSDKPQDMAAQLDQSVQALVSAIQPLVPSAGGLSSTHPVDKRVIETARAKLAESMMFELPLFVAVTDPKKLHPSPEEDRSSGLMLLLLLAQAYYKILECAVGPASWATRLDLQLNLHYFWTISNLTNLLKNNEYLRDFPDKFEPAFPDLNPSTIGDVDWEEMVAPGAEQFLSTVQKYVLSKPVSELREGTGGWMLVEVFKNAISKAVDYAIGYNARLRQDIKKMCGAGLPASGAKANDNAPTSGSSNSGVTVSPDGGASPPAAKPRRADRTRKGEDHETAIRALLQPLVRIDDGLSNLVVRMIRLRNENPYGRFSDPPATNVASAQVQEVQDRISALTNPIQDAIAEAKAKCAGIAQYVSDVIENPAMWETDLRTNLRLLGESISSLPMCEGALSLALEQEINSLGLQLYLQGTRLQDVYETIEAALSHGRQSECGDANDGVAPLAAEQEAQAKIEAKTRTWLDRHERQLLPQSGAAGGNAEPPANAPKAQPVPPADSRADLPKPVLGQTTQEREANSTPRKAPAPTGTGAVDTPSAETYANPEHDPFEHDPFEHDHLTATSKSKSDSPEIPDLRKVRSVKDLLSLALAVCKRLTAMDGGWWASEHSGADGYWCGIDDNPDEAIPYADDKARQLRIREAAEYRDNLRQQARELCADNPALPVPPLREEDAEQDIDALTRWCMEARPTSVLGADALLNPPNAEPLPLAGKPGSSKASSRVATPEEVTQPARKRADPIQPPEAATEDADELPPALTVSERLTLATLATFPVEILVSVADIIEGMDPKTRLGEKTVRDAIKRLAKLKYAERPQGDRQGARLTISGRLLAPKITA